MYVEINHKGPGCPYQLMHLDDVLKNLSTLVPFVFTEQKHKDFIDAMCLMIGKQFKTMMWADIPVDRNMFFTYVFILNL